jgi:predicted transcriptional regulator
MASLLTNRRTPHEIMAEILGLCVEPQGKTRVMYRTNLSWSDARHYLSVLTSLGMLEVHHSCPKFVTTEKGIAFIKRWSLLEELMVPSRKEAPIIEGPQYRTNRFESRRRLLKSSTFF